MFQKILVAMDSSPMGEALAEQALALAQAHQAHLMLLHVLSTEEENSPIPIPAFADAMYWAPGTAIDVQVWHEQWQRYENECLEQLQERTAAANRAGVNAEFRQISGSPSRVICQFAQLWEADLIIVGNRGRTGLSEFFLGSVSNYVLHHAPCSVLTVKVPVSVAAKPTAQHA
ncbi:MAG: universal stress protein [Elainellaceae cyanobacterium]